MSRDILGIRLRGQMTGRVGVVELQGRGGI